MSDNLFKFNQMAAHSKRVVVVDCDEVLVNISPKAVKLMHEDFDYYNKFFRLSKEFDLEKQTPIILNRPEYYINKWLLRKDVLDNYTIKEYEEAEARFTDNFNRDDYYEDLIPTNLGLTLSKLLRTNVIEKLIVVSKVVDINRTGSKERFLKKLFRNSTNKLSVYFIESGNKKSEIVNLVNNDKLAQVYEDEVSNIEDIINNTNKTNFELMIPSLGYNNTISDQSLITAKEKGILIKYY